MAKFITIMSGKGGVGKTTTALNLGLAMHKLGEEVIVLDGNLSSPNLTVHLGNTYYPVTIHDVMEERNPIRESVYSHHTGLKIIPAELSIQAMKQINFEKLEEKLHDLHLMTDYVLIDGSPGLGRESTKLIEISDEILLIVNQELSSVIDAKRVIDMLKFHGKTLAGIIVTKHKKKNYRMSVEDIEKFLEVPILKVIPEDRRFEKAAHKKTPYIHLHPKTKASKGFYEIAEMLTGKTQ